MTPEPDRAELGPVLELAAREAAAFLAELDRRPVRPAGAEAPLPGLGGTLPEDGVGALAALRELALAGRQGALATSGPRCFHFVIGGVTPAALAADWLTSTWDQVAYAWVTSPLAVELERISLGWLRELFGLPAGGAVMTTGATMANFVGLAAARQWWGDRHGADVARDGLSGLPQLPVLTSGLLHASARKALAMLGLGHGSVRAYRRDDSGQIDLDAIGRALRELDGAPAVLIANAGEVNAGLFDPIGALADLAAEYGAWLHVDGAFGLFAAASPRTAHLVEGVERAQSVTSDGHKWLNVPYDCGFSFVRDESLLRRAFTYTADYLPAAADPRPCFGAIGPESSRRARAFAVWATLRAYGRSGYRALVERGVDLARYLARRVDDAPDLQRLAEVSLNIVCFRYDPGGLDDASLDRLNRELGEALLADGRVYAGTTVFRGRTALRPALSSWRTCAGDVDVLVDVVREIGGRLRGAS